MTDSKLIYDLLKEVREDQKKHTDKQSLQSEELAKQRVCLDGVEKNLEQIKKDVAENKEDWREHMGRTAALEKLHEDNQRRIVELEVMGKKKEERIKKLEAPAIAKVWIKENIKWVLTVGGLVVGLMSKLMGWW